MKTKLLLAIILTLLPAAQCFAEGDDASDESQPQVQVQVDAQTEVHAEATATAERYCRIQEGQRASGYGLFRKSFYNITTVVREPGKEAELDFYNDNEISSYSEAERQLAACNVSMQK